MEGELVALVSNEVVAPVWFDLAKLLNPTTATLTSESGLYWLLNTAVALTIITTCLGVSAFVLSRYRMQDR